MDDKQKTIFEMQQELKRGAAIIEGKQDQFRMDGYVNMLNKYGTKQDNSTAYRYVQEPFADDMDLVRLYEGNGLFKKIIDRPSDEAVKHGLNIDFGDEKIKDYVEERLDDLEYEEKFATAEKWARLYGGSIIVMLCNDGGGLEEPLDDKKVTSIEELRVFERAIVQPDYSSLYQFNYENVMGENNPFNEPEWYEVYSIYGCFRVHRSRCLVFRNGVVPEQTTNSLYRFWGVPEYVKIKDALRECITTHHNGSKLLDRSVQAIYKMKNLANLLATKDGEDKVIQRLQVIDMARGILNSIAIDNDGEDYDYKSITMSGVKDIIDATCNMLSAVTDIPQTILFGRSPAGMNATGEGDMENYYSMIQGIQATNMKANSRRIINFILQQGQAEGEIEKIPKFKVEFASLRTMTDEQKAAIEQQKASTEFTKAQTAQIYMGNGVLDPSEVRTTLAQDGDFQIENVLTESDLDENLNVPDDLFDLGEAESTEYPGKMTFDKKMISDAADTRYAASILVIKDGKILCAERGDRKGICGPGGHLEEGETYEEGAIREAMEEFGIKPRYIIPFEFMNDYRISKCPTMVYLTDEFDGEIQTDDEEMFNSRWLSAEEIVNYKGTVFPAFMKSVTDLVDDLKRLLTRSSAKATIDSNPISEDGGSGSGNHGHGGRPGKVGGSSPGVSATGSNSFKKGFSSKNLDRHWEGGISDHSGQYKGMTKQEYAKKALDLVQKPVGGNVKGYKTPQGEVVRYDTKSNDFVKGNPTTGIKTMFKPKDGIEYYNRRLIREEGIDHE